MVVRSTSDLGSFSQNNLGNDCKQDWDGHGVNGKRWEAIVKQPCCSDNGHNLPADEWSGPHFLWDGVGNRPETDLTLFQKNRKKTSRKHALLSQLSKLGLSTCPFISMARTDVRRIHNEFPCFSANAECPTACGERWRVSDEIPPRRIVDVVSTNCPELPRKFDDFGNASEF